MRLLYRLITSAALAALAATPALAATSSFDTDSEGWISAFNGAEPVMWAAGAIDLRDSNDAWSYLQAPVSYLLPIGVGGSFSFDLRHVTDGVYARNYGVRVALAGNGTTLIAELAPPTDAWLHYSFSLAEGAGWRVFGDTQQNYSTAAPLASLATLGAVLGSLSGVYISTDYTNGTLGNGHVDRSFVDNVALPGPVPEPGSWVLMLGGLAALGGLSQRLRRVHPPPDQRPQTLPG